MISLFLLVGCNLSYIVDLFAALHELASASARTLLKLASSVRARLKRFRRKGLVYILMRPPLSSPSSTKPRGSKIRACSHSDLGEFLF